MLVPTQALLSICLSTRPFNLHPTYPLLLSHSTLLDSHVWLLTSHSWPLIQTLSITFTKTREHVSRSKTATAIARERTYTWILTYDYFTMTSNMSETLLFVLCGEECWHWSWMNKITFNKNGTGEVNLFHVSHLEDIAKQLKVSLLLRDTRMDRCGIRLEAPKPRVTGPGRRHQQYWRYSQEPASNKPV